MNNEDNLSRIINNFIKLGTKIEYIKDSENKLVGILIISNRLFTKEELEFIKVMARIENYYTVDSFDKDLNCTQKKYKFILSLYSVQDTTTPIPEKQNDI